MTGKIRNILLQLIMSVAFIFLGIAIEKNGDLQKGVGVVYAVIPGVSLLIDLGLSFIKFDNSVLFPVISLAICAVAEIIATLVYKVSYPDFLSLLIAVLAVILKTGLGTAFYFMNLKKDKLQFKLPDFSRFKADE